MNNLFLAQKRTISFMIANMASDTPAQLVTLAYVPQLQSSLVERYGESELVALEKYRKHSTVSGKMVYLINCLQRSISRTLTSGKEFPHGLQYPSRGGQCVLQHPVN